MGGAPFFNSSFNTTSYEAPNITSVLPRSGPHLGSFVITIDGNNFGLEHYKGGSAVVNVTGARENCRVFFQVSNPLISNLYIFLDL